MPKLKDMTGLKLGRLTVIEYVKTNRNGASWLCKCECGNDTIVGGQDLRTGHTKSCGCLSKDKPHNLRHGMNRTRLYVLWGHMISRCRDEKDHLYGGRGISVCDDWKSDFMNFYNWSMDNGYTDKLSIDRIDVNGNYEPSNCRWVTMKEQQRNRRNNVKIEYQGKQITLAELAEVTGIKYQTILTRRHRGYGIEDLVKPVKKQSL